MTPFDRLLRSLSLKELAGLRRNLEKIRELDDRIAIEALIPKLRAERERRAARSESRRKAIRLRVMRLAAHDLTVDLELDPSGRSRSCSRCGATRAEILAGIDCER